MVERICPQCQHANPLEHRFCGQCGHTLVPARALADGSAHLPMRRAEVPTELKHIGKAMAISLAALAAEAGMAWLRRRVEQIQTAPPATQQPPAHQPTTALSHPATSTPPAPAHQSGTTIWRQRVVQTWESGTLTHQTVERTVWRREG